MERMMPFAITGVIALLVAGLTHFSAILILPSVATRDAYSQLAARFGTATGSGTATSLPVGMVLLPPSRPGDDLVPFRDPATEQALCFFDLTTEALRIRTKTEDDSLLTLSFRTVDGRIFYAMTNRTALNDTIDIRLVGANQAQDGDAGDGGEQALPTELRLRSPTSKGLVVATALVVRSSEAAAARDRVKAITCAPEPLLPPS